MMATRQWSTFKMCTIANIVALALGACTFQAPMSNTGGQADQTGCPTPTAVIGDSLGAEESGQANASPVGVDDLTVAAGPTEQLSPAEREAILDRVNQGPARPDSADTASVPPVPGTESPPGDATTADAATDLDVAPTPTPCP